jgi:predicted TIM-barrel enzyme
MQDDGRSTSVRRLDLRQSPAAHGVILTGLRTGSEPRLDSPS